MSEAAKRRLFVGTFLSPADQARIAELHTYGDRLSEHWHRRVRWVQQQKLHLTWLFLGHVEDRHTEEIKEKLQEVARRHAALRLVYTDAVFWPNAKAARMMVLVPNAVTEEVYALASDVKKSVGQFQQRPEARKYRPHITLLRLDDRARLSMPEWFDVSSCMPIEHDIQQIDLIQSHLGKKQEGYESLASFPLS
jgi:2'-5' RNA ligase